MSNSYSLPVESGNLSLFDFIAHCSRHFLGKEGLSPEIPTDEDFLTNSPIALRIKEIQAKIVEIESWDFARCQREAEQSYQLKLAAYHRYTTDKRAKNNLRMMTAIVNAWSPPNTELGHDLKNFALQQLEDALNTTTSQKLPPTRINGEEHRQAELKFWKQYLQESQDDLRKGLETLQNKREAITLLRQSLSETETS